MRRLLEHQLYAHDHRNDYLFRARLPHVLYEVAKQHLILQSQNPQRQYA